MNLRDLFLLEPGVVFLNHGSFGATPLPVLEAQRRWQRRLELQPVRFFQRELPGHLGAARRALGEYLGADPAHLAFVPNATHAVNLVARSMIPPRAEREGGFYLRPGDEILTTDHEYGACENVWRFVAGHTGARLVRAPVALPLRSDAEAAAQIWSGVTERTRVIFLSHITSPTALTLPVGEVCSRARRSGILTVVDGAHAPGQISLDLGELGADLYTGNCHKWMCAPKGSGFLYARPEAQAWLEPLVVSWGWGQHGLDGPSDTGSPFLDNLQWPGTVDFSAYLSVAAAIAFQAEHGWDAVRARSHALLTEAAGRVGEITGREPLCPAEAYAQMAALPLPQGTDVAALKARLYDEHRVEVPCFEWNGVPLLRVSVQGYNTAQDLEALAGALGRLLTP